jgi:hypothetical protein
MAPQQGTPIHPMAADGYGLSSDKWVRVTETHSWSIVVDSGKLVRAEPGGAHDEWLVTGRSKIPGHVSVSRQMAREELEWRDLNPLTLLELNPSYLRGQRVTLDGERWDVEEGGDNTTLLLTPVTSTSAAPREVPVADIITANGKSLSARIALLVDKG